MNEDIRNKLVYQHRRVDNNQIFYIGIGDLKRAQRRANRNSIWNNITNKTDRIVEVVCDNLTWKEACEIEKYLIAYYGRIKHNTGTLSNITEGGEGFNYWKGKTRNKDFKDKASNRMLGNSYAKGNKNIAKKVIDVSSGEIYDSITEAAESVGIKRSTLGARLSGQNKNNTNLRYL